MRSRREPALVRSAVLATVVHLALIGMLFFGVRMQSHPPAAVTVELWEPPPAPVVKPQPEPPKPPPPVVKPEPEPQVKKPDIVIREKPKPKPKPDLEFEKRLREQAALESRKLEDQRRIADEARKEKELRDLIAREQADALSRAIATWTDKIRARIRPNIIYDVGQIPGNAEAIFDVALLPTGEVLTVQRRKSSGYPSYDEAVERAILKSSPLPKPDQPNVFQRKLELRFRPLD